MKMNERYTLKDEYRGLLDAKLSAWSMEEALDTIMGAYGWDQATEMAAIDRPSIFSQETDPALYELEMSVWANAYTRGKSATRYLPKSELRELLKAAIIAR